MLWASDDCGLRATCQPRRCQTLGSRNESDRAWHARSCTGLRAWHFHRHHLALARTGTAAKPQPATPTRHSGAQLPDRRDALWLPRHRKPQVDPRRHPSRQRARTHQGPQARKRLTGPRRRLRSEPQRIRPDKPAVAAASLACIGSPHADGRADGADLGRRCGTVASSFCAGDRLRSLDPTAGTPDRLGPSAVRKAAQSLPDPLPLHGGPCQKALSGRGSSYNARRDET